MTVFLMYNPNPAQSGNVGDCAVRAVAKALDITWEDAYTRLVVNGFLMGDMPNSDVVVGSVLRQAGFKRGVVPNTCPDCYTVADFAADHPIGTYVLKSENHLATVVDGTLYDAFDSSRRVPFYFWEKQNHE